MKSGIGFGWGSKGGGGALATGILQLQGGVPLDTTLRRVADQAGTLSPLQLSTTQVAILEGGTTRGLKFADYGVGNYGGIWAYDTATPTSGNYSFLAGSGQTYLNGTNAIYLCINNVQNFGYTTTGLAIGQGLTAASARLHVRGDGTNPIARFDSSVGVDAFEFRQTSSFKIGTLNNYMWMSTAGGGNPVATGEMMEFYSDATNQSNPNFRFRSYNNRTNTAGTASILQIGSTTFGAAAGSANFSPLNIQYTINNSGVNSGVATGIYSRATETNLNGMLHNLIDLGTTALGSLFSVTNVGAIKVAKIANADAPNSSLYFSSDAGRLTWKDAGGTVNNLY